MTGPENSRNPFSLARLKSPGRPSVLASSSPSQHPTHALQDILTEFDAIRFDHRQLPHLLRKVSSSDATNFCLTFIRQALQKASLTDSDHIVRLCFTWLFEASPPDQLDQEKVADLLSKFSRQFDASDVRQSLRRLMRQNWHGQYLELENGSVPQLKYPPAPSLEWLQRLTDISNICRDFRRAHYTIYHQWSSRQNDTDSKGFSLFSPGQGDTMVNMEDLDKAYNRLREPTEELLADALAIRMPQLDPAATSPSCTGVSCEHPLVLDSRTIRLILLVQSQLIPVTCRSTPSRSSSICFRDDGGISPVCPDESHEALSLLSGGVQDPGSQDAGRESTRPAPQQSRRLSSFPT